MTALDTAKAVLAKASLADQTIAKPDINIARQWAEILGDIDLHDALTAVDQHYTEETRRLMPADVRNRVRKIRAERVRNANSALLEPPDIDPNNVVAYLEARRERGRRIANGEQLTEPVAVGAEPRDVKKLLTDTAKRMPRMPPALPATPARGATLDRLAARRAPINRGAAPGPVDGGDDE